VVLAKFLKNPVFLASLFEDDLSPFFLRYLNIPFQVVKSSLETGLTQRALWQTLHMFPTKTMSISYDSNPGNVTFLVRLRDA
jgi:hypothetical protein